MQIILTTKVLIRLDWLDKAGGAIYRARGELSSNLSLSPCQALSIGRAARQPPQGPPPRICLRSSFAAIQSKYRTSILCPQGRARQYWMRALQQKNHSWNPFMGQWAMCLQCGLAVKKSRLRALVVFRIWCLQTFKSLQLHAHSSDYIDCYSVEFLSFGSIIYVTAS